MGPGWGPPPHPGLGPPSPSPELLVPRPSWARSRRRPRRARFLRPSAPGSAVAARGVVGPRGPRRPGPEAPRLGSEAGCADAGSGSAGWFPLIPPVPHRGCEVPGPQESELRNPSEVLLPEGCAGFRASVGETGSPQNWTPHPQLLTASLSGLRGRYEGHVGTTFASPGLAVDSASISLACRPDPEHQCGGVGR